MRRESKSAISSLIWAQCSTLEGQEPIRILAGNGGIGKTDPLKQFQHLVEERHIPWAQEINF